MVKACLALAMASGVMFGWAEDVAAGRDREVAMSEAESGRSSSKGGFTFEINVGLGILYQSVAHAENRTDRGLAVSLGVGAWIEPKVVATLRVAGVTHFGREGALTLSFMGPSLQTWVSDKGWFGVGMGLGTAVLTSHEGRERQISRGLGLDVRLGYTLVSQGERSLNLSVEATPVIIDDLSFVGIGFLLGYQHL